MSSIDVPDQELILRYQGFVRSVAITAWKSVLGNVDLEDLIGYGQVGLVQAARSYDPQSGVEFATYAFYRVRGAIFDGYASMQWLTRSQYRRICERQLSDEVIQQQEMDAADANGVRDDAAVRHDAEWTARLVGKLVVIRLAMEAGDRGVSGKLVADKSAVLPAESLELEEARQCVRQAVAELPDDERLLIESVYFGNQSLTAAAKTLGKSKSWASRLHDRALERLLRKLQAVGAEISRC
jgi:RNA polymerase sigma factor for flagellar operon FliA